MGGISSKQDVTVSAQTGLGDCPVKEKTPEGDSVSACPVSSSGSQTKRFKDKNQYNVYNQKLNPTNQMPLAANQSQSPGQRLDLSVDRVKSTIPKGGTEKDTWQYPSPQMFWNALVKKNKTEGASEKDIAEVVAVHNNMNEKTWKQVVIWEDLMENQYEPTLLRFLGRPDELSPKARLRALFGHPKPFDRHDWYVSRGGEEVRYIIDYYHDESNTNNDVHPKNMHDATSIQSIKIEVRPALDSVSAIVHRAVKMPWAMLVSDPRVKYFTKVPFLPPKK